MTAADIAREIREQDITPLLEARGGRRRGKTWHCLFHEDKRPSASVHRNKLHCFVCDRRWSAIDLVMELDGLDLGGAIRHLADFYGLAVQGQPAMTPEQKRAWAVRRQRAERMAGDAQAWKAGLVDSLEAEKAAAYCAEDFDTIINVAPRLEQTRGLHGAALAEAFLAARAARPEETSTLIAERRHEERSARDLLGWMLPKIGEKCNAHIRNNAA